MTQVISTTVSNEFHKLAKDNNIAWSEALRVGLSVMLGDLGIQPYDNNLNLFRKMNAFRVQAEQALQQLAELETRTKPTSIKELEDANKHGII